MKRKTSRFTTADITLNTSMLLGACGDAWTLTAMGDGLDVIDHRPYADGARTPVGLCADAPLRTEKTITLADIVLLMAQDDAAFAYWQKAFPLKDF